MTATPAPGTLLCRYALVAGLLGCCAGVNAQARPPLELPAASRLRPVTAPGVAAGAVAFAGATTVHAILVAQWVPDAEGTGHAGPSYQLLPVPQSAAQLPHFKGLPLKFIAVSNGLAILARATSPGIAQEFAARVRGVVHVEGIYAITDLRIGAPCAVAAQAEVLEVDPVRVRFPGRPEAIGCPP